jgi:hypothetical protein
LNLRHPKVGTDPKGIGVPPGAGEMERWAALLERKIMDERFWLITKNKQALLAAMMNVLCGNAHISLEGDLSKCDFSGISGITSIEMQCLTRTTLWPKQDFIIIPLEQNTIQPILTQIKSLGHNLYEIIHTLVSGK